jgi:hypothetical protein
MQLTLHITLKTPPANITYALQKGSGSKFEVLQVQKSTGSDLYFELTADIKGDKETTELPDFKGPFVQGPAQGRFIYLGIGSYAGDNSFGGGRIKIPLTGITWQTVVQANANPKPMLETTVPGTAKNGGPTYATVKPFDGWKLKAS